MTIFPKAFRFVADLTVGKTAKWLRILGFDTLLVRHPDEKFLSDCLADGRIFVTRDSKAACRRGMTNTLLLDADSPISQLADILNRLGLQEHVLAAVRTTLGKGSTRPRSSPASIKLLSRCIRCNEPLVVVSRSEIVDEVPDFTWSTQSRFRRCPECLRVYWEGTHKEQILGKIRKICNEAA